MKIYEQDILDQVNEKIIFSLYRNISKEYIIECLNDFIYNLPKESSVDLLLKLCEIRNKVKEGV